MLDSFACATTPANSKLMLQGKLYITDRCCYFYSPFNHKTLLGKGSKICASYSSLETIRKETTLLLFSNSIRLFFKSGEQILFQSFLSRDNCYNFMVSLMTRRGAVEEAQRNGTPSSSPQPKKELTLTKPKELKLQKPTESYDASPNP